MRSLLFTTCLLLSRAAFGLYSDNGPVVKLTESNFKDLVLNDKNTMWLIEFYAPWCGHCKKLAPIWDELAEFYKDEKDLVNKIQFIKQNDISEISKNGYELSKKHSYKERVKILFGL